jgi:hypothetical protein
MHPRDLGQHTAHEPRPPNRTRRPAISSGSVWVLSRRRLCLWSCIGTVLPSTCRMKPDSIPPSASETAISRAQISGSKTCGRTRTGAAISNPACRSGGGSARKSAVISAM